MDQTPLRILHLTAASDAGGVSRYIHDLCEAMHKAGHEVAVAGQRGAWHDMFAAAPWPWIDAPLKGGPLALRRAARILSRYLIDHPVDVIHAHYRKATLVARRLQVASHPPLLYTLHLSHIPLSRPWRWLTDFGDHLHAAATESRQWLIDQAHIPAERITLIPHGIDPQRYPISTPELRKAVRAELTLDNNHQVALFVGRLDDPKNVDWMLDLAAASEKSLPQLRVLIAGDGPHETQLRKRIQLQNLASRVQLLGHRHPLKLYHAADALLLPSAREGFSYVCAEAMCAGLPVLRTRTSGTADLILENKTGRSCPIDHNAFIQSAIEFLSSPTALHTMGPAAADHIRSHFTFTTQLDQTIALYRRLAGSSTGGTSSSSPLPTSPLKS